MDILRENMTDYEVNFCTKNRKCDNQVYINCPSGPNEAKHRHEECQYFKSYSNDAFQCLSRGDKYPSMFKHGIFDTRSRTQGINLNIQLEFDDKGVKCNNTFLIEWTKICSKKTLKNVEGCELKDGTLIPIVDLCYLVRHDMGFNGRRWLSIGQRR